MRTLKGAACAALSMALAFTASGCPKKGTDSGTPGTDAGGGTDAADTDATPGTDAAPADAGAGATLTALVYEILDDTTPVAGANVDLYDIVDTAAATSLASGVSNTMGLASLTLAAVPANVFAKVSGATGGVDTYSYWNFPVTLDKMRDTPYYGSSTFGLLAAFGQMPGNGYASGAVVDCMGNRVAGATVTASSGTVMYIDAGTGLPDTTPPILTMTDASGAYVVVNAATGTLTLDIVASSMPTGCATMMSTHDVESRADTPLIAVTMIF